MDSRRPDPLVETAEGLLGRDLAGKYRQRPSDAARRVDPDRLESDWTALQRDGYVVVEGLLGAAERERIRTAFAPLFGPSGRNPFEGYRTERVYSVLEKTRGADALVEHPRVLALLDRLFTPHAQLPALGAARDPHPAG